MEDDGRRVSRKRKSSPDRGYGSREKTLPSFSADPVVASEVEQILEIFKLENSTANRERVHSRLTRRRNEENRLQLVIDELLNDDGADDEVGETNAKRTRTETDSPSSEDSFFRDLSCLIDLLRARFPDSRVDESAAYETLNNYRDRDRRLEIAFQDASSVYESALDGSSSQPTLSGLEHQPAPATKFIRYPSSMSEHFEDGDEVYLTEDEDEESRNHHESNGADKEEVNLMERWMGTLISIFPDVKRTWLMERVIEHQGNPDCIHVVSNLMMERSYPREEQRSGPSREELKKMELDVDEFLKMFPDPVGHFYGRGDEASRAPSSESYVQNALHELAEEFSVHSSSHIKRIFNRTRSYALARRSLMQSSARAKRRNRVKPSMWYLFDVVPLLSDMVQAQSSRHQQAPEVLDEGFFRELWFVRNEERITELLAERAATRQIKMDEARKAGLLATCPICFDDELLPDELLPCSERHEFCPSCVKKSAEVAIGEGLTTFKCLFSGECKGEFQRSTILSVLPWTVHSKVEERKFEQDLRLVVDSDSDIVKCPFCIYVVSMPNREDKVVRCQNPSCLKESCRMCGEPNHIPLRCDQVEKKEEMSMRKKMENDMSDAVIRVCPNCSKRFLKEDGCNKMTCRCGTTMCYLCRKANVDYSHFGETEGMCSLRSDTAILHVKEAIGAAEKAREEFSRENPGVVLKHDPTLMGLREERKVRRRGGRA